MNTACGCHADDGNSTLSLLFTNKSNQLNPPKSVDYKELRLVKLVPEVVCSQHIYYALKAMFLSASQLNGFSVFAMT